MRTMTMFLLLLSCLLWTGGCKSSGMVKASAEAMISPTADSAVIVFMRPSMMGGAIQSVVYDISTANNELVGIVSSGTKVAFRTKPGEHMFMVIGENADFMKATLDANKTYYALVTPRMGAWRARFSLKPVHAAELTGSSFKGWDRSCVLYDNTDASRKWALENNASVQSRREEYMKKYDKKSPAQVEEVTLLASDGR